MSPPGARSGAKVQLIIVMSAAFIIAALVVFGYLYYSGHRKVVGLMQMNLLQSERLDKVGELTGQLRRFNSRYGRKYGRINTIDGTGAILNDINEIQENENLPNDIDSLIMAFENSAENIQDMERKINRIENSLGSPHVVQRGDSHADIVMDFLTREEGLTPAEAKKVMKRTALIWELTPGNYVYNIYYDGIYLTTVTQGTAPGSPLLNQQRVRERTQARIDSLEVELEGRSGNGPNIGLEMGKSRPRSPR